MVEWRAFYMRKLWVLALAVVVIGVLTACGGGSSEAVDGNSATAVEANGNTVDLNIEATNFKFDKEEYRVKAGDTVNISLNSSQGMHGLQIKGMDVNVKGGESASFVAQPGEYDIICSIMCGSGHSKMTSKLIVE
jgi:cytochrome c oxidase subunit 2